MNFRVLISLCLIVVTATELPAQYYIPAAPKHDHLVQYLEESQPGVFRLGYSRPLSVEAYRDYLPGSLADYYHEDSLTFRNNLSISYSSDHSTFVYRYSPYLFTDLTPRLHLGVQADLTNHPSGANLLGSTMVRFGNTGRFSRAWIGYTGHHFEFVFGRDALQFGPGQFSQLHLNGDLPPYDMVRTRISKYGFNLFAFAAFLPSVPSKIHPGRYVDRYLAGRRLEYISPGGKLIAGIGDLVLYTGENRPVNLAISNPFLPMYPLTVEGLERMDPDGTGDNENIQVMADLSYRFKKHHRIYSEFILDDFQYDPEARKVRDDATGITLGYSNLLRLTPALNLHTQTEFTVLNTWVYNHPGQSTSWMYKNRPMGNTEGGDVREFHLRTDLWHGYDWSVGLQIDYIEKGETKPEDPYRIHETKHAAFPLGTVEYSTIYSIDIYWYTDYLRYLHPYIVYERNRNDNHRTGSTETDLRFGIELFWWFTIL